ncbi:hypothetical protein ACA910_017688 [Epithemia clementina (nom. ined.)]
MAVNTDPSPSDEAETAIVVKEQSACSPCNFWEILSDVCDPTPDPQASPNANDDTTAAEQNLIKKRMAMATEIVTKDPTGRPEQAEREALSPFLESPPTSTGGVTVYHDTNNSTTSDNSAKYLPVWSVSTATAPSYYENVESSSTKLRPSSKGFLRGLFSRRRKATTDDYREDNKEQ